MQTEFSIKRWKMELGKLFSPVRTELRENERNDSLGGHRPTLTAFDVGKTLLPIVPASGERKWMRETRFGFANRCLPLKIANQAGWFILNDRDLEIQWDGRDCTHGLNIRFSEDSRNGNGSPPGVTSHFGYGIVTWTIPYLFRTSPGYNLYVRGPANWCKDGICPLDAIVEADWPSYTFTMNWKVTRSHSLIRFEKNEPICMVFPCPRGLIENFQPELRSISENQELEVNYNKWSASRTLFNQRLQLPGSKPGWQKQYYAGKHYHGAAFQDHQTRLDVAQFSDHRTG